MRTFVALMLLVLAAGVASAEEFVVTPGGANKVVFTSKAPVESFEGKTSKLSGSIVVTPGAVGDSVTVHMEVDLASLDTGIEKRNQHMREAHLETAKYPTAVFTGVSVVSPLDAKLVAGKAVTFETDGTFTLHGVTRRLHATTDVTLESHGGKNALRFRSTFKVSLDDYAISRPQLLWLKLADVQDVKVTGVATAR